MGRLINGANGSFTGKVGNVVGSSWCGINYVKQLPKPSSKPKTERQLAQQMKFALAVRFLKPIKDMLFTFARSGKAATGLNQALSYTLKHAIIGEYPNFSIDYSMVALSMGRWCPPLYPEVIADNGSLLFSWTPTEVRCFAYGDDEVFFLLYDPESNSYFKGPRGILRCLGFAIIPLPEEWQGKTVHAYGYCASRSGNYSTSSYVGRVENL